MSKPLMLTKHTTNLSPRLAVIGAGPSGLAVSLFLKESCEILEALEKVGGHAASFELHGFTFDYGPHILFSRDQQILDFLVKALGENVNRCRRNNKISYKDKLLKYPFENDLKSLDLADNYDCISHFLFNPYKEKYSTPGNMKEWFLKTFGEGLCNHYLLPYTKKVWNIPVEELSMVMASRIPEPNPEDILKSSLGYSTEGYLHQLYYYYPKKGGYQAISESLKQEQFINYGFKVNKIQRINGKIRVFDSQGRMKDFERLISTMPVDELLTRLEIEIPQEIQKAVERLIMNPMFVISFGIRGVDTNQYTAVYFPEAEFLVNRVSYPCTFSKANAPEGHWSLQAEITCAKNSTTWKQSDAEILAHTKQGLQQRQLLPADEHIVLQKVHRIERSYVVYNLDYEENAQKVRTWFASIGIYLLGRFSYFEYINVDMAVDRAIRVAADFNGDQFNEQTKTAYLTEALLKLGTN